MKQTIILDIDGTLADNSARKAVATRPDGMVDWEVDEPLQEAQIDELLTAYAVARKILRFLVSNRENVPPLAIEAAERWLENYQL